MCGFTYGEAVGRNPRLTQGERTDPKVIHAISGALKFQKPCKVQLVNYRGGEGDKPFWNMLSISPLHHRGELQLCIANLQDYSYFVGKMVSLTPSQFCRAASHYERGRRVSADSFSSLVLAKPAIYETDETFPVAQQAPQLTAVPMKRLGWCKLELEPEHLADRVADAFERIDGCRYEVRERTSDAGEGVVVSAERNGVALRVVVSEETDGRFGITCTRLSGDTFAYHDTFRALRELLGDALTSNPLAPRAPLRVGGHGGAGGLALAPAPLLSRC